MLMSVIQYGLRADQQRGPCQPAGRLHFTSLHKLTTMHGLSIQARTALNRSCGICIFRYELI